MKFFSLIFFIFFILKCKTPTVIKQQEKINIKLTASEIETIPYIVQPNTYVDFYYIGNIKLQLKQYEGAIKEYQKSLVIINKMIKNKESYNQDILSDIYRLIGIAQYKSKKYKSSIKNLSISIKIKPNFIETYNSRGIVKSAIQKYFEAIKDYDKAIEMNSSFSEVYNNRGVAKFKLERYKEAIEDFNIAISLSNKKALFYINRGSANAMLGLYKKAFDDYSIAINLEPENKKARLYQLALEENMKSIPNK